MPLLGKGFLIIWHDIKTESKPEYHRWHTREHMPERLSIPGFLRGRRGVDPGAARHEMLTIYEGADLGVFGSPAYLERLNNPTPWSLTMQPTFLNFIRSACDIAVTTGEGVGGALLTFRLPFGTKSEADLRAAARPLAEAIMQLDGVSSVHIGIARPEASGAKTRETELRGTIRDGVFDAVLVVDGIGRRELAAVRPAVDKILRDAGWTVPPGEGALYDMAFCLDAMRAGGVK
jgi:hypothetical protein